MIFPNYPNLPNFEDINTEPFRRSSWGFWRWLSLLVLVNERSPAPKKKTPNHSGVFVILVFTIGRIYWLPGSLPSFLLNFYGEISVGNYIPYHPMASTQGFSGDKDLEFIGPDPLGRSGNSQKKKQEKFYSSPWSPLGWKICGTQLPKLAGFQNGKKGSGTTVDGRNPAPPEMFLEPCK